MQRIGKAASVTEKVNPRSSQFKVARHMVRVKGEVMTPRYIESMQIPRPDANRRATYSDSITLTTGSR